MCAIFGLASIRRCADNFMSLWPAKRSPVKIEIYLSHQIFEALLPEVIKSEIRHRDFTQDRGRRYCRCPRPKFEKYRWWFFTHHHQFETAIDVFINVAKTALWFTQTCSFILRRQRIVVEPCPFHRRFSFRSDWTDRCFVNRRNHRKWKLPYFHDLTDTENALIENCCHHLKFRSTCWLWLSQMALAGPFFK